MAYTPFFFLISVLLVLEAWLIYNYLRHRSKGLLILSIFLAVIILLMLLPIIMFLIQ